MELPFLRRPSAKDPGVRFGGSGVRPNHLKYQPVIHKWMRMLLAILLGNLIYWAATPFLPDFLVHGVYRMDGGLLLDFAVCTTLYVILKGL